MIISRLVKCHQSRRQPATNARLKILALKILALRILALNIARSAGQRRNWQRTLQRLEPRTPGAATKSLRL